MLMLEH